MLGPERQDSSALIRRAVELHQRGRFRDALQLYQRVLLQRPDCPDTLTYSAAALLEIGKAKEAAERLRAAQALRPDSADIHGYLGNALQILGRLDEAEASFERALELAPENPRLRNNYGVLLLKSQRPDKAADNLKRAVAAKPDYAEAQSNLSQAYLKLGRHKEAAAAAARAVQITPRAASAHNNLGNVLAESGRYGEAIAAFREAVELRPTYVDALNNLAVALVASGESAEALAVTDRCLAVHPGDVTALATRSVALSEAGDSARQTAPVDFERLIEAFVVDPDPDYENLAAFNAALAQHILEHPSLKYAPAGHATRGGQHSGDLLAEPKGPVATLERIVNDAVHRYAAKLPGDFQHPFLARKPERWFLDVWAVVMDREGHQVEHIHPSGWLSGVYYVSVSEAVSGGEHEGWIEFGRPQTIYKPKVEPPLKLVRPEEGLMVLFPSFVFHRTIPFEASAQRICIAFDVCPSEEQPGRG